jgi:hypothetical protein
MNALVPEISAVEMEDNCVIYPLPDDNGFACHCMVCGSTGGTRYDGERSERYDRRSYRFALKFRREHVCTPRAKH